MKKLTLDFRPRITRQQIDRLAESAAEMETGDELTIVLESSDAHQADQAWAVLNENGFDLQPHGGHEKEYYLKAKKK